MVWLTRFFGTFFFLSPKYFEILLVFLICIITKEKHLFQTIKYISIRIAEFKGKPIQLEVSIPLRLGVFWGRGTDTHVLDPGQTDIATHQLNPPGGPIQ